METAALKSFATWARRELITEVGARLMAVLAPASIERVERADAVRALERDIEAAGGGEAGRTAVIDRVAYTWFNRIIALRFMDANGYTGVGVVSPAAGQVSGQPEILADAKQGRIDTTIVQSPQTLDTITALLDGVRPSLDPQAEVHRLLLTEYCRHWHRAMPFMFEQEGDYTELLLPGNLLAEGSVLSRAVETLTVERCTDKGDGEGGVEVIGWLYQFYISERKDEVFAGFKKGKKAGAAEIPAATQLFTPHWIVRYLVENSVGRLWMLNHPESRLVDRMDYYIAPVDEETDFLKLAGPEELTVMDPACGSGHMLTYAFDLLYAIYEEEGYPPSKIPGLILEHNLYGLEIDPRAGALAAFALVMKARAKQNAVFNKGIYPRVQLLESRRFADDEIELLLTPGDNQRAEHLFWNQLEHASELGSLLQPDAKLVNTLKHNITQSSLRGNILDAEILKEAEHLIQQVEYLSQKYSIIITNPPYMGTKNMGTILAEFTKRKYPRAKADLFAAFMERSISLGQPGALIAAVTMHSWMFISSFEQLRKRIIQECHISNMAHLGARAFDSIGGAVVATTAFIISNRPSKNAGLFLRLVNEDNEIRKRDLLLRSAIVSNLGTRFERTSRWFQEIPGSPISYWLSEELVRSFAKNKPLSDAATPRQGLATTDNGQFLRRWYEVSMSRIGFNFASCREAAQSGHKWFPYNKGGSTRRWYGNHDFVVNWKNDGREIKENIVRKYPYLNGNPNFVAKNTDYYFKPSISWSLIGTGAPAFRAYPQGFIFDVAGTSVFPKNPIESLTLLGYLNSSITESLLSAIAPTMNLVGGDVARIPVPALEENPDEIPKIVGRLISLAKLEWDSVESSWGFQGPPIMASQGTLAERASAQIRAREREMEEISALEVRLDKHFCAALGVADSFQPTPNAGQESLPVPTSEEIIGHLVSYAVGCMFGRYSLDEPGLILADQGATLQDYLRKVPNPSFLPDADNVLPIVDGEWFQDDIVARFRAFLRAAFGDEHFEENLRFVEESLGVKQLRDYFVTRAGKSKFYENHVKRYKKRPIYWLFSSPKGSFNALVYLHRYTPATVSTVLNEYLHEYEAKLQASLHTQEQLAVGDETPRKQAAAAKEAERLRKVLLELDEYERDVLYPLATRQLEIDLDDGVKANYPKFGRALRKIPGLEAAE